MAKRGAPERPAVVGATLSIALSGAKSFDVFKTELDALLADGRD